MDSVHGAGHRYSCMVRNLETVEEVDVYVTEAGYSEALLHDLVCCNGRGLLPIWKCRCWFSDAGTSAASVCCLVVQELVL